MALISAATIISSISIFHLISAYFLLTNPSTVLSHNLVVVLGAAVGLPLPDNPESSAGTTPLLAALLILTAIADLAAASLPAEVSSIYWGSQTQIRLAFFFGLTAWSYSRRPGGWSAGREESLALAALQKGGAGGLGSGIVFSWAFLEMIGWFWVFITLRDERREALSTRSRTED